VSPNVVTGVARPISEVPVEGSTGGAVVPPTAGTLRAEMVMSGQISMAAHVRLGPRATLTTVRRDDGPIGASSRGGPSRASS
jgi:hypothetical protein